jgi:hypothetical protein
MQALSRGLTLYKVDGSRSAKEMATLIEQHFEPFLRKAEPANNR